MSDPISIRLALLAMCYREVSSGKWAKPVGSHIFTYRTITGEWANWCRLVSGGIERYESHRFLLCEDALIQLKSWEAFTRINVCADNYNSFELSAIDF